MESIEEMKKKRFKFLKKVHENTEGNEYKFVNMWTIGNELGFDENTTEKIYQYLSGQGLIEARYIGGGIGITHYGIVEMENALSNPDQPTTYFPPVNIISIGQMINSQIQQGSPGAEQLTIIEGSQYDELKQIIESLKESIDKMELGDQEKSDLQADVKTIEAQMTSSKPKGTIINECLSSIRGILEGATGSIIASGLIQQISTILGS